MFYAYSHPDTHMALIDPLNLFVNTMEKKSSLVQKIQNLMIQKGIDKRKQASTMAEILGIKYNSARQKLDEKRGMSFSEARDVFRYFNENFDGGREYNCIFIIKDVHKRCNIETEETPAENLDENDTYAIKNKDLFIINTNVDVHKKQQLYRVKKIDFLPSPKLAILDNDTDILDLLNSISSRYGIDTYTFKNKEEIINSLKYQKYDCYILDWLLDFGETSEEVIVKIREDNDKNPTILILTGQINHFERIIGEAIVNHGVELIEKPTRAFIISSILLSNLFFRD